MAAKKAKPGSVGASSGSKKSSIARSLSSNSSCCKHPSLSSSAARFATRSAAAPTAVIS